MSIITGELDGLGWCKFEIETADLPVYLLDQSSRSEKSQIVILGDPRWMPNASEIADLRREPKWRFCRYSHDLGVKFFDAEQAFPGCIVLYSKNLNSLDFDAWARTQIDIPANIDLHFTAQFDRQRAYVTARTERDGRMVLVKKKIPSDRIFPEAVSPLLAYFAKACPAPVAAEPRLTCSQHVAAMLMGLNGTGHDIVSAWMKDALDTENVAALQLSAALLPGTPAIRRVTLFRSSAFNVHASIDLKDGGKIEEDDKGVDISLRATLPATVLTGLRGLAVSQVVDIPWLEGLTIRTAGLKDEHVRLRAGTRGKMFELGPRPTDDEEASVAYLWRTELLRERPYTADTRWSEVDEGIAGVLEKLQPQDLAGLLARLSVQHEVALDYLGFPGWVVKSRGDAIALGASPARPFHELLTSVTGGPRPVQEELASAA